jgi:hypothetical protein
MPESNTTSSATTSSKRAARKRTLLAILSIVFIFLWMGVSFAAYHISAWGDGATTHHLPSGMFFPFLVLGVGLASCFLPQSLLWPCGVVVLLGVVCFIAACLSEGGLGVVLATLPAGYGLLWWKMYLERRKAAPNFQP